GELQHGGSNANGLDWYLLGNYTREHGWRDESPSRLGQVFSKLGCHDSSTAVRLSFSYADTKLYGNGLQDQRLLERDYSSVYTKPDITANTSHFLNLTATHGISDRVSVAANAYYRHIRTRTLNGAINDESLTQAVYQPNAAERAALGAAGYTGFPSAGENASTTPFPFWRCIANVLLNDEPGEKCNGLINRTRTDQSNFGTSIQLTLQEQLFGHSNQFTGGAGYDANRVKFRQTMELGFLTPDRGVTGTGAFADGVSGGLIDGQPFDNRVDLSSRSHTWSAYATNTFGLSEAWYLTFSGCYSAVSVSSRDNIDPGGGPSSLDGDHTFRRFNPAAGIT